MKWFEALGLRWPIVQAPMAGVQDHQLAAAVGRAGALGSIPGAMVSLSMLRQSMAALASSGVGAYNVNFFCHEPLAADPVAEARWRESLKKLYADWGVSASDIPDASPRVPFDEAALDTIAEFKPRVISFHFGLPAARYIEVIHAWGGMVFATATTAEEARWLESRGADVIVAQGLEAGGHRGIFLGDDLTTQLGTFSLVPQVVDAVKVPVLAAGGVADARGVAAAIALGAAGVQVGTAFLMCPEAQTSAVHRIALGSEVAHHTALTNVFTGRPARGIVNQAMRELGPMTHAAPAFPHAATAMLPLRFRAEAMGRGDCSPLWSGQGGCLHGAASAREIVLALSLGTP